MYLTRLIPALLLCLSADSLAAQEGMSHRQSHPAKTATITPVLPPETDLPSPTPHESWTAIRLADSGLPPGPVNGTMLSRTDLAEGCTRELIRLQWRPSDPIDLYVIHPNKTPKPPVGIFLLNYTFDTSVFRDTYWCSQASENHLAVVAFGSMFSKQRFHSPRPMKQWFVSELQESLATSTHDVQMVLNYLATRSDLDTQHVGLYGQGSGGAIGVLAVAADPRITALQIVDPWGDWPDWLKGSRQIPEDERANFLQAEFLKSVSGLDPVAYLPSLKLQSLRIQQVMTDPVTPTDAKEAIAKAAPDANDVIRFEDDKAQHKAVFLGGITEWLAAQLNARSSQ